MRTVSFRVSIEAPSFMTTERVHTVDGVYQENQPEFLKLCTSLVVDGCKWNDVPTKSQVYQ